MVLGILGSGRQPGNSHTLLQETLGAVAQTGVADVEFVALSQLNYRGCIGCKACRSGAETCVLEDDLTPVIRKTAECDALLLAAPIYYGYPSGIFKSYLDRWYCFRDGDRNLRVPKNRHALLILPQGHPDADAYEWTGQSMERILSSYGFSPTVWTVPGLEEADAAAGRADLLEHARQQGLILTAGSLAP